ncbi:purine catabolism regulatory protein [Pedococcus cremeus]|uniref:Purine catabolism regulatory protein n=1 Tax=Pedococcus cremeus TaxID=587636 RepID=A0A1H9XLP3_9MICO|nr:purine catabolism regulatory protein [Pedococcus cremeus]
MVKVANDDVRIDGDLTSSRADAAVSGVPLSTVTELPAARGAVVVASSGQLQAPVVRTVALVDALDHLETGEPLGHRLVIAPADALGDALSTRPEVAERLAGAGVAALAVTGVSSEEASWRDVVEQAGIPLLLLPGPTSSEQLNTEVLGAMLDYQTSVLDRLEEVHRVLVQIVLAGGSLEDLCEQLAGFFDGAAMVTTTDGRVLASAGVHGELEHALSLDCFDRTGRLITENEPVGIRALRGPEAHRAAVRIVAGALDHGLLVAFCSHRMLTGDDVRVLERAATVAALAVTKEQAVSAVESKYRAEFLRDALAGRAGSVEEAIAHARSLGWDIDRPMVVVVAETDEDDAHTTRSPEEVRSLQHRFARAWTHAVAVRDPGCPVMGFSQEVVTLLPVTDTADTDKIMRTVSDVARVVRGDGGGGRRTFSTGVSRPITSVAQLPQAYDEALNAVTVGRQMHGDGALTHFDGLGIFRLLALIPDSKHLRRFVEESLGELATDDSPENADLRQTLSILIDTNMNVAETARLLFFHYNTLRYRIVKLEKMLGPFTTDPQLRLTLALALKVHQMRGI